MPTLEEEQSNPQAADSVYEAYGDWLREQTRDKKAFPLIFSELVNYGFRRNLWGMKSIAVPVVSTAITIQVLLLAIALRESRNVAVTDMIFLALNLFLFAAWIFVIKPQWVKVAADAYADRLLAASESIQAAARRKV